MTMSRLSAWLARLRHAATRRTAPRSSTSGPSCVTITPMTTHTVDIDDPTTTAHDLIAHAAGLAYAAEAARRDEDHSAAGIYREQERSAMRRAEALTSLAIADSLQRISTDLAVLRLSL